MQSQIVKFPAAVSEIRDEHEDLHRVDVFTTVGVDPDRENRLTFDGEQLDGFGRPTSTRSSVSAAQTSSG